MEIRYLGHSAFALVDGETTVLIDPFLTGNPKAAASADDFTPAAILLTHGHSDHFGDTVDIAKRSGCTVQAITEIAGEIGEEGVEAIDTNFGGTHDYDWGWCRIVPAFHTSTTPNGTVTPAGGLIVSFGGKIVYHVGDTALFSDIALPGKRDAIDVALVPIGGHYTMDRHDAAVACGLIGAKQYIPCHYNTFPPIEADAGAFKSDVEAAGSGEVIVLAPGESHTP